MSRGLLSSRRAFPVAIAATVLTALLPDGAMARVTRFPAELMRIIFTPLTLMGNAVGQWVRPPPPATSGGGDEYSRHLVEELAEFERLYVAEQLKVEQLQEQLQQLQNLPPEALDSPARWLVARVALRSPGTASGGGTVTLARGADHGVKPGSIAVYNRAHLVGRVTDDVSPLQCTLMPLTNPQTGLMVAAVLNADRPGEADGRPPARLEDAPKIQLEHARDGTFTAQAESAAPIAPGDVVRLIDQKWPASAQGMVIGRVESVRPNERQPLRNVIVVKPAYEVSQIAYVTLRIELDDEERAQTRPEWSPPAKPMGGVDGVGGGSPERSGARSRP